MSPVVVQKKRQKPKQGKTKASSHKASIGKLANKKTSRLAKQGKLNKGEKKKKKKQALQEKRNQEQQAAAKVASSITDGDEQAEESEQSELSDEDTEFFEHLKYAREFARQDLSQETNSKARSRKRKRDSDEEEEEYEQQPRSFASENEKNMKMLLPIINKGKVIKQMTAKEQKTEVEEEITPPEPEAEVDKEDDEEKEGPEDSSKGKMSKEDEEKMIASLTPAQMFAYRKHKIAGVKQRIASLAQGVIEDPQNNMRKLKELRLILGESSPAVSLTARKLATVSLAEVFKDIVPGYRLRVPTEKEMAQRVKKETKSLWDYEASFLLSYRVYLTFLELTAKGKPVPEKSFLTKHGISNLPLPRAAQMEMSKLCLNCLCTMLTNHPHFNYRNNIITTLIPFMNSHNQELSKIACGAVRTIFKEDKSGDVSLEIVKTIGRIAKKLQFEMHPQVIETFLALKIKEIDLSSPEEKKKMLRKEKMLKFSRRERKKLKQKEQLDKELLETKASADKQHKLKNHTEIIQAVFETYIRVIKLAAESVLLPAVLKGLARFAHLINIEYFDSLFSALNNLIESQTLTDSEMLHCMQTAFTILSGQGTVINIDPTRFYKHFYAALMAVHAGQTSEMVPSVLECLHTMIHKRRKQMSQQRILAFIKRLSTLCLQQTSESALALLASIRQFVQIYQYSNILFDTEAPGSGCYLPELPDPEHCCANSTSLWELLLMRHHYHPRVRRFTLHLLHGAPTAGEHQLKNDLARKSPMEMYETFRTMNAFDGSIPEKPPKKKKMRPSGEFACTEFGTYLMSVFDSAPAVLGQSGGRNET